jgi:hypothetical protein
MSTNPFELLAPGNIFLTSLDINPVRVIMGDGVWLVYEVWWKHAKDWSYKSSLKSKVIYYRASSERFFKDATYFAKEQLTEEEIRIHRPDLPLNLCRSDQMSWTSKSYATIGDFEKDNSTAMQNLASVCDLKIGKIIFVPYGPKGGLKKGVKVEAQNGMNFTCRELLWNAQNIEAPHNPPGEEKGVGIFRLGFEKGIPSYYIGGFIDTAGFLNEGIAK